MLNIDGLSNNLADGMSMMGQNFSHKTQGQGHISRSNSKCNRMFFDSNISLSRIDVFANNWEVLIRI